MSEHSAHRGASPHSRCYLIVGGACLDKYSTTRSIALGGKNRVKTRACTVGGGGANVAIGLKHLDTEADVFLIAATGEDRNGTQVRRHLTEHGVTLPWAEVPRQVTSRSDIVIETETGHSTIFTEQGARTEPVPLDLVEELLPHCDVCWLVAPTRSEQIRYILQLAARSGVPVFFGLGGSQIEQLGYRGLTEQLATQVELLICNRGEAAQMTDHAGIPEQLEALRFGGRVRTVVITDGQNGIHAQHEGRAYHESAYHNPSRPVVDETGAGDAAQCVIGHWLLHGRPLEEGLRAASRQGFEAVTDLGATTRLLTGSILREYIEQPLQQAAA